MNSQAAIENISKRALKEIGGLENPAPAKKQILPNVARAHTVPPVPSKIPLKVQLDKIQSADKAEMVSFLKKIFQKFPHVAPAVFAAEYPSVVQQVQSSSKKTDQKKILADALKEVMKEFSAEETLREMICSAVDAEPLIVAPNQLMDEGFHPKKFPHKFPNSHPMLSRCFMCKNGDSLKKCFDLKVCEDCSQSTYTKQELNSTFSISAKDANGISHSERTHGYYKSTIYIFQFRDAAAFCNKKFGCLSNFVRSKMEYEHRDILRGD